MLKYFMLNLKIITPQKIAFEKEVVSVTAPSAMGEITILPSHSNLFTVLNEGVVTIRMKDKEDYLAIGGGYLETDGKEISVLVSRVYGQDQIDAEKTQQALDQAKKIISQTKDKIQRKEALSLLRRSSIDLKLLKRRKIKSSV